MRERQVHVVAAEQQVVADRQARQREAATFLTDLDLHLTAATLAEAAQTLTTADPAEGPVPEERS